MRSGCRDMFLRLGTLAASVVLITVGGLLILLSYFSLTPSLGVETIISLLVAVGAAYVFVRVGRDIWQDLRAQFPNKEDPDKAEDPGEDDADPPPSG